MDENVRRVRFIDFAISIPQSVLPQQEGGYLPVLFIAHHAGHIAATGDEFAQSSLR
jgi:hypothetical protein